MGVLGEASQRIGFASFSVLFLFFVCFSLSWQIYIFFDRRRQIELIKRQNRGHTLRIQAVYKESKKQACKKKGKI